MSKSYNQFQSDVSGAASSLMTQMLCAERGISFEQLQHAAQQSHVNSILQAEQQRQMNQVINRHYQGTSIVSKVRDVFGGQPSNFLLPQPQAFGMPMAQPVMQPQIGMPSPFGMPQANPLSMQGSVSPHQLAQYIGHQAPVQPEPVQHQPAPAVDMNELKAMITQVVSSMIPQQPAYSTAPSYPAPAQVAGELDV